MKENHSTLLTEGSIWKKIILFAIPVFWGNVFQQLYTIVDSLIVGNFIGNDALAAVSSSGNLIFLMVGFFNGIAMGAGVVISKYFGAKDYKKLQLAIHTDIAFGLVASVILTILGIIFTPQILKWMGTPESVLPNSILFFRIYFVGVTAVVMYNIAVGILQAIGDSRHPLYYLIVASIVNVALDLFFVGVLKLGVGSAALATVISQTISAILCFYRLMHYDTVYRVSLSKIRFNGPMFKQIIQLGLPSGVQNSIIGFANVIVQSNINAFGVNAMAGCGAYSKIEGFAFLPITCFSMALTTFVGQNLGAGKFDRVKKGAKFGIACSVTMAEIVGIIIWIGAPIFIRLFNDDPTVIAFGTKQSRTEALFYCLLAFSHCIAGIMRGAGKAIVPMITMLITWCLIRITYITVAVHLVPKIGVIFWAYPLTWSLSSIIFLIYYKKVDWLHNFERLEAKA
ncbi:putative efflux protein, MATE family [Anaerosporobacter mobilis DSM 15930]|uniref:Probable multidrug resistance protein NorM n=1 Tax=Anaerosporobacter mobilis DSM 15930 TaxID=1120996 RepID=A0A1M7JXB5_9FIRM|nr:MATE family efflux transporter [Anaerosporobacter mobilis]SHM57363.1 putative efflux protein, MATE family [Anaerosporobacter mobilis DSM 15930]